jgi:hypothetical protein
MDEKSFMLRHFLAALAYRTQKALRGAPESFATFSAGNQTRTPAELVRHMTSVLGYSRTFFIGGNYRPEPLPTLADEVVRFHEMLEELSDHLEKGTRLQGEMTAERLLQGPVAPENFIVAKIDASRLGPDQPEPASPDEFWREAPND